MTLRISTFFCNTESKLFQEIRDSKPLEIHYWKKVLFNHASETGHEVIITEHLLPGTKDKKQL